MTNKWVALIGVLLLAGCAAPKPPPQERIILLPDKDGGVGAIDVQSKAGTAELREAYTVARVGEKAPVVEKTDALTVMQRYGKLLDGLPARPSRYTLNFEFGSDRLTAASRALVPGIQADLRRFPAPEVVVSGHTDAVGDPAYNDKLSHERAQRVREILVGAGIPREAIQVVGRGAREPLVAAKPGAPEPRNRRVDIKLR